MRIAGIILAMIDAMLSRPKAMIVAVSVALLLFTGATLNKFPPGGGMPYSYNKYALEHIIPVWIKDGYLSHGGLYYVEKDEKRTEHPGAYHYRGTSIELLIPYILEKINFEAKGELSYKVMVRYNQLVVLLSSIMLGFVALRMASGMYPQRAGSLLAAVSCVLVFQTFPFTLSYYWGATPQLHFTVPLFASFLIIDSILRTDRPSRSQTIGLLACSLLLFLSEFIAAFFFLSTLIFLVAASDNHRARAGYLLAVSIAAGFAFIAWKAIQMGLAHYNFPDVGLFGSNLLFRTGLDGNRTDVLDHYDLFIHRHLARMYPGRVEASFSNWPALFAGGAVSFIFVLYTLRRKIPDAVIVLTAMLSCYVLYAFIFLNAVAIHSDLYDILLFAPEVLVVFCLVPALILRKTENGFFSAIFLLGSVCYAMVQLRSYALFLSVG